MVLKLSRVEVKCMWLTEVFDTVVEGRSLGLEMARRMWYDVEVRRSEKKEMPERG